MLTPCESHRADACTWCGDNRVRCANCPLMLRKAVTIVDCTASGGIMVVSGAITFGVSVLGDDELSVCIVVGNGVGFVNVIVVVDGVVGVVRGTVVAVSKLLLDDDAFLAIPNVVWRADKFTFPFSSIGHFFSSFTTKSSKF